LKWTPDRSGPAELRRRPGGKAAGGRETVSRGDDSEDRERKNEGPLFSEMLRVPGNATAMDGLVGAAAPTRPSIAVAPFVRGVSGSLELSP